MKKMRKKKTAPKASIEQTNRRSERDKQTTTVS